MHPYYQGHKMLSYLLSKLLSLDILFLTSLRHRRVQTISCYYFCSNRGARVWFIVCVTHQLVVAPSTYFLYAYVAWLRIVLLLRFPLNSPRKVILNFKELFYLHTLQEMRNNFYILFKIFSIKDSILVVS